MIRRLVLRLSIIATFLPSGFAVLAESSAAGELDFARDVQPILQQHCVACHGSQQQQAGLRLDVRETAMRGGDYGPVITPERPDESRLLQRVTSDDPEKRMPLGKEPLTGDQLRVLRRWIELGAVWPDAEAGDAKHVRSSHWAFQPVHRPDVPATKDTGWARNAIDRFVLQRLEAEGLRPSPEADRYALVRRLYLDLIGLPPTPEQADAFARDEHPDAYERLVDQLLASPHYGERWARRWLDLARYADTNGYEKDRERSIWLYRDWVIDALNRDLPFDQFTIEQLAGDLLPESTLSQNVATGFHRNTMINEEGGIDVEEFRFHSVVDRVATTGTTWLGLTIACAQCHSHKYDPITQREYYQFFAIFNNADEPELTVPDPDIAAQRRHIHAQLDKLRQERAAEFPRLEAAGKYREWLEATAAKASRWHILQPLRVESERGATMTTLEDASVLVSGDIPNLDAYRVVLPSVPAATTALRLEVLPHESLPNRGPGRAVFDSGAGEKGDFLLSEITLEVQDGSGDSHPVQIASASHSYAGPNRSAAFVIDGELDTGWSVAEATGQPHHLVVQLAEPLSLNAGQQLTVRLDQHYIHQMTIGRFRLSATSDSVPVEAAPVPADVERALTAAREVRSSQQEQLLRDHFLSVTPELQCWHERIAKLEQELPEHPTTMVMCERLPEHRRETRIHHRGEFLQPRELVQPGVPAVLPPLPSDAPRNRLTLARWLVDAANPLTGRVVMNRHWEAFFGRGLVETVENFGTQAERPTHAELLDWLADEFVRRQWSIKAMHRLMVTSATYRQQSTVTPELSQRDPQNRLLGRAARVRVDAEVVRDLALAASGLLTRELGGPSVFPPQPDGVTALSYGRFEWQTSQGADRYRRGLYTFMKRTSPYATLTLFDAPSGETCVARRERSNTPLQALTLLNDTVYVEAAQALAESVCNAHGDNSRRCASELFRRCLTRPAEAYELNMLVDFYKRQLERIQAGELNAAALVGPSATDGVSSQVERQAAWTAVARALLNLDEMIVRP